MASISTPVRAATRASQTSVTVPSDGSTVTVGSTWVSGSECASGISSSVRLAAWMAARRATVATSPLGASPAATRAAAVGDIRTTARARAQRDVSAFSETSTIRALPAASRCVSVPPRPPMVRSVKISVRLFAGLRERAGSDRVELELPDDARASDVLAAMGMQPGQCIVALDREYAAADALIRPEHEVALIPPVSGGAGPVRLVAVTDEPLDLAAVAAAVRDSRAGAVVCFEGVTRDVEALDYEAYAEMAREKLEAIGSEESARHGLCAVALVHRVGRVPLSEPSVIVAASAAHRGDAFAGARALIDRVKAEAPIWKVELTAEGERRVEGVLPDSAAWRT